MENAQLAVRRDTGTISGDMDDSRVDASRFCMGVSKSTVGSDSGEWGPFGTPHQSHAEQFAGRGSFSGFECEARVQKRDQVIVDLDILEQRVILVVKAEFLSFSLILV